MARPERTIIALNTTDARRFARSLMKDSDRVLFFEEARSWGQILRLVRKGTGTMILLGARPPDKAAVKALGRYADSVVILQHAVNKRRRFKELPPGYFLSNFKKLIYWSVFILLCKLVGLLGQGRHSVPTTVYHFTSDYLAEWIDALGRDRFQDMACPRPDPTRFGTIEDIPVVDDPVAYQLIDEPFRQTMGISKAQETGLLQSILDTTGSEQIMVKPHPRSQPGKYDFSDRFVISNTLYSNAEVLIGYRSGLLDYPFLAQERVAIIPNGQSFVLERTMMERSNEQADTYLDCVERDLRAKKY